MFGSHFIRKIEMKERKKRKKKKERKRIFFICRKSIKIFVHRELLNFFFVSNSDCHGLLRSECGSFSVTTIGVGLEGDGQQSPYSSVEAGRTLLRSSLLQSFFKILRIFQKSQILPMENPPTH